MTHTIKNWGENFSFTPDNYFEPQTEEDFLECLAYARAHHKHIRALGSKYSYTPLIHTNDVAVCMDKYAGLVSIDQVNLTATFKAGTKIHELQDILDQAGYGLLNLGDINKQTISGLMSTGSHGTGLNFGCVGTQVKSLKLLTAEGEIVVLSQEQTPELFKASLVSLGTLGIILEVELSIVSKFHVIQERGLITFDEAIESFQKNITENRYYEFFWLPHTTYCLEKKTNLDESFQEASSLEKAKKSFNDLVMENGAVWALCELGRKLPDFYKTHANSLIKNLVTNDVYHLSSKDCFSTKRLVKHDEIEYALPLETGVDAIKEIADFLNTTSDFVMFPVEIRTSKKDDIPLSPGYGRDSIWIAVHTYSKDNHQEIFKNCEKIFLKYNGRPHWGKFHYLRYSSLKQLYPEFEVFNQLRKSIDSQGVFLNDYLESLFEPSKV